MQIAEEHFGIPQIISPDNMASPNVDELSMMTYLSYFTQDNGVGEKWTANLVNGWNPDLQVSNFNTDWNNGRRLGNKYELFMIFMSIISIAPKKHLLLPHIGKLHTHCVLFNFLFKSNFTYL